METALPFVRTSDLHISFGPPCPSCHLEVYCFLAYSAVPSAAGLSPRASCFVDGQWPSGECEQLYVLPVWHSCHENMAGCRHESPVASSPRRPAGLAEDGGTIWHHHPESFYTKAPGLESLLAPPSTLSPASFRLRCAAGAWWCSRGALEVWCYGIVFVAGWRCDRGRRAGQVGKCRLKPLCVAILFLLLSLSLPGRVGHCSLTLTGPSYPRTISLPAR